MSPELEYELTQAVWFILKNDDTKKRLKEARFV